MTLFLGFSKRRRISPFRFAVNSRGFSLIELTIVLGVLALLLWVMTPLIVGHLEDSRITRATADLRTIADAVRLYRSDVGEYPIFSGLSEANSDTAAATLLTTASGDAPAGTNWTTGIGGVELERFLNGNYLNRPAGTTGGRITFRGPYIGRIESDPWGNKYYLTAANLEDDSLNYAFAISAGPNATLDTTRDQPKTGGFTAGGDDIALQIR